jgi:hypothetical protein
MLFAGCSTRSDAGRVSDLAIGGLFLRTESIEGWSRVSTVTAWIRDFPGLKIETWGTQSS